VRAGEEMDSPAPKAMGRALKVLTALAVIVAVTFVCTGVALAATVMSTGLVTVSVQQDGPEGHRLFVPVPALALDLGLGIAAVAMPADELERIREEARPFAPALRSVARELERCPDATLVEVVTDHESVRVVKRGSGFVIDVDAEDGQVRVALPARSLTRVAAFLDA
jgi:hypothetical protein